MVPLCELFLSIAYPLVVVQSALILCVAKTSQAILRRAVFGYCVPRLNLSMKFWQCMTVGWTGWRKQSGIWWVSPDCLFQHTSVHDAKNFAMEGCENELPLCAVRLQTASIQGMTHSNSSNNNALLRFMSDLSDGFQNLSNVILFSACLCFRPQGRVVVGFFCFPICVVVLASSLAVNEISEELCCVHTFRNVALCLRACSLLHVMWIAMRGSDASVKSLLEYM